MNRRQVIFGAGATIGGIAFVRDEIAAKLTMEKTHKTTHRDRIAWLEIHEQTSSIPPMLNHRTALEPGYRYGRHPFPIDYWAADWVESDIEGFLRPKKISVYSVPVYGTDWHVWTLPRDMLMFDPAWDGHNWVGAARHWTYIPEIEAWV